MFRFSVGFVTSAAVLSMVAASLGDAAAQAPGKKAGPAAPRRARLRRRPDRHRWPARRLLFRVPHRPWPVPRRWPALLHPSPGRPRTAHGPANRRSLAAIAAVSRLPPRSAPSIQRAAPASRAASRIERRQQAVQQRQQNLRTRSTAPASAGNAVSPRQQTVQNPRLQQLQSKSRLSRADRRELRTLQRSERQNAQRNNLQPQNAQTAQQDRLQQLQSKGRLSRAERRELRTLQRSERQNAQRNNAAADAQTAQQDRLQQLQSKGRLSRAERRELRTLQRDERQNARQQQQQNPAGGRCSNPEPAAAGASHPGGHGASSRAGPLCLRPARQCDRPGLAVRRAARGAACGPHRLAAWPARALRSVARPGLLPLRLQRHFLLHVLARSL